MCVYVCMHAHISLFFYSFIFIFICLAAPGLNLQHVGSLVAACEILAEACRI